MNRTICVAVLSLMAIPQTHAQTSQPRYLRGMLVIVGESKESKQPVRNTKVFVRNVGSAITTDTGEFRIQLPTAFRSGRLVTLAIEKPGFVIHYPLSGEFRLPDDELDEIEIRILPEGSKLLWTDQRIERFIEQTAEEASGELRPASVARGDLAKYVLAFGLEYGFTEEEVHTALQEWAEKAKENATDFRQVGLAAFAEGRLDVAAPSLRKAGMDTINDGLKDIEDDSIANGVGEEKVADGIDDVVLGGDAYFMGNQYNDAIETYYLALKYVDQKTDRARWRRIKFRIGNAASNLGERVDAEESVKILHQAIESYREASEQTERLANATHWADINHNLGLALTSLANRTGGEEARDLYAEARKVLLEALKINTQERLPTRWANSQIALGNVLQELGKRADGSQVSQLLTEAVEAYENALQVQSRVEHAESWANTQSNLGNALSLKGQLTGGQEGLDLLFEAEHAIQEALSVRTDATQWARAKLNLAIVKAAMGRMISGKYSKRLLLGSLVACQDATRSFTLAEYPQQWARASAHFGQFRLARQVSIG
ncbi:hypothetical protein [Fuerstiella marisgermanici]|uniref:Tetratricopeptide repeat protein n=1 Tax=Fuerstiella marisgermanici TaxID=1891926 RepID=A0A1P8WH61_9PLAN|nr:hypothetical protein [Fuerstiella marisgermanici]APZ93404.1 hypothetical protein Fuma_03021 [Fuerstiella marisgermanici]